MRNNRITRQEVFAAAKAIARRGKEPTLAEIRFSLGDRGSQTTVHKYLTQWKEALLKRAVEEWEVDAEQDPQKLGLANQEKILLKEALNRQIQKNEVLSGELFSAERQIASFREENADRQQQLAELQQAYQDLEKSHEQIKAVFEGMCLERDRAVAVVIEDKNRLLDRLQEELRETHRENLARIRELSFQDHDLLMQEKVKTLNYEEKIKTLKDEVKRLSAEHEKAQRLIEPLKQEIAKQKKLIEDKLTFEQLAAHLPKKDI